MKSRLIYIGEDAETFNSSIKDIQNIKVFHTSNPSEAKKFLGSRFPDVVVVSTELIGVWDDNLVSELLAMSSRTNLVVEFESISTGTVINLANTFGVNKFIKRNSRDYSNLIQEAIDSSNENPDVLIDKLEKKIARYEYVMEQYLIEG